MNENKHIRVLFVCMGNICRSPTAEGVFRALVAREAPDLAVEIDSAGTHGYHVGSPPDRRALTAARDRGFDLESLRARELVADDFERFDYVIVMDATNLADAARIAPARRRATLCRFLDFAPETGEQDVPDPYYGGRADFERVLDLTAAASRGLIRTLRSGG
jgi:protein-tyrosine phosphatase